MIPSAISSDEYDFGEESRGIPKGDATKTFGNPDQMCAKLGEVRYPLDLFN